MKELKNNQYNNKSINLNLNHNVSGNKFKEFLLSKCHIFFAGIGGISVSSLAIYAKQKGFNVSGSDISKTELTTNLEKIGIKIFYKQQAENIKDANLIVYSNACEKCPEVLQAKRKNIPTLTRAQFLSILLKDYNTSICVTGAHGKTTTTALIYSILKEANKMPSLHLGGNLVSNGKNYDYSNNDYIVCEACEYKDSFLELYPNIAVILNIAPEHLDYFKTFENVKKSFGIFANQAKNLVIYEKCELNKKNAITFGFENANFTAKNIKMFKNGKYSFDCYLNNQKYLHTKINLIGKHNILNALASIAVSYLLHIPKEFVIKGLSNFCGIERRYQYLHKDKFIVHDYAHHPDEIESCIKETKMFYKNKLLVVFQPHTFSRTKTLMKRFVNTFKSLDEVLILPTYSAREKYDYKGSAKLLAKNIGENAIYIRKTNEINDYILEKINQGYGILFLGAGNIYNMAKNIVKMC